jgi:hypothetical protein
LALKFQGRNDAMTDHYALITIAYRSCDGFRTKRRFKTLKGAQKYAHHMVGPAPELGGGYAISGDAVGRVTVQGATLAELFPKATKADWN